MLKTVTLALAIPLLAGACASKNHRFGQPSEYYIANGPLDSMLLHLRSDGTFNLYSRTHFTIEEQGKGTWRGDASGDLELAGGWKRHVVQEPFDISGFGGPSGLSLMEIRAEVSHFIKSNPGPSFPADGVTRLGNWDEEVNLNGKIIPLTRVPISVRGDQVTKKDLETLIEAIDAYPRLGREDLIHVTPVRSGSKIFLHWRDGGPGWARDSVEELKEAVQRGESPPSFSAVFIQVTLKEFQTALGEGHPFLFHPEMNPRQK